MEVVKVETLKERTLYNADLLLNKSFIILPAGNTVTTELIKMLKTWDIKELNCPGTISMDALLSKDISIKSPAKNKGPKEDPIERLMLFLEDAELELTDNDETAKLKTIQKVYKEYLRYINFIYTHYATHKEINQENLERAADRLCEFVKEHKRLILLAESDINSESKKGNFLVNHSLRSTLIAIIIGIQLHMEKEELMQLSISCILHEIGMIRVPPQFYMTDKQLTSKEFAQMCTHTLIGYNILKDMNFSPNILSGVLEHHEKENGTGYPRHMTGEKISTFAKVIAVACSFEAISAPRDYKEERTSYDAMVEMLKNSSKQYDEMIIKALLAGVSLYPIGTFVYLANGKIGLVAEIIPNQPRNPIVQLLTEKDEDGNYKMIQTDDGALKISRVLSKKETTDVLNSLSKI